MRVRAEGSIGASSPRPTHRSTTSCDGLWLGFGRMPVLVLVAAAAGHDILPERCSAETGLPLPAYHSLGLGMDRSVVTAAGQSQFVAQSRCVAGRRAEEVVLRETEELTCCERVVGLPPCVNVE